MQDITETGCPSRILLEDESPVNNMLTRSDEGPACLLQFRPLHPGGRTLAFPCDTAGRVHLDSLNDRVRNDYFYARLMVGREFAPAQVRARAICENAAQR